MPGSEAGSAASSRVPAQRRGSPEVSLTPSEIACSGEILQRVSPFSLFAFVIEQGFCGVCFVPMKGVCSSELDEAEAWRGCGSAKSRQQIGSGSRYSPVRLPQKASLTSVGCVRLFSCFGGERGHW